MKYIVNWEEEIEADSATEAAQKASAMLLKGAATEFDVTDELGNITCQDLAEGSYAVLRSIPPHRHDFVGDEDTCVVYTECPVTWAAHRTAQAKDNPHSPGCPPIKHRH